jgi:hypothetical protein
MTKEVLAAFLLERGMPKNGLSRGFQRQAKD